MTGFELLAPAVGYVIGEGVKFLAEKHLKSKGQNFVHVQGNVNAQPAPAAHTPG